IFIATGTFDGGAFDEAAPRAARAPTALIFVTTGLVAGLSGFSTSTGYLLTLAIFFDFCILTIFLGRGCFLTTLGRATSFCGVGCLFATFGGSGFFGGGGGGGGGFCSTTSLATRSCMIFWGESNSFVFVKQITIKIKICMAG